MFLGLDALKALLRSSMVKLSLRGMLEREDGSGIVSVMVVVMVVVAVVMVSEEFQRR